MRGVRPMILAAFALGGCGEEAARDAPDPLASDPALEAALADEIMVDPDLVGQNREGSAISVTRPSGDGVPPAPAGPEAAAQARAEAVGLAGGALRSAPQAAAGQSAAPLLRATMAAARGNTAGDRDCAGKVEHSARWAALLPAALPVYPRGAVREAAGADRDGCALRVVSFETAVTPDDVIDFYFTRATAAGYGATSALDGKDRVLGGRKGAAAFVVYARAGEGGRTEVDLVTGGA